MRPAKKVPKKCQNSKKCAQPKNRSQSSCLPSATKTFHKQSQNIRGQCCRAPPLRIFETQVFLQPLHWFSILCRQVCSMNQVCNHLLYLSAKFGALNQRINRDKTRSSENQLWALGLPQVLTLRFVNQSPSGCLTWLQCFLGHHRPSWTTVYMPTLCSMQAALERSSIHASCPREIKQP